MTHVANLYNDWIGLMRSTLANMGVSHDPSLDDNQLSLTFWNFLERYVHPKPRKVFRAKGFQCPAAMQAGLDALTAEFETGQDVNAHLSKSRLNAKDPNFFDGLFDDWRVQHFHLGPGDTRTKDCLFARVTDAAVYYLDVLPHKPAPYGNVGFVQSLHDNWPEMIAHRKTGIKGSLTRPTEKEIRDGRKGHVTPLVSVSDGTVYLLGGISSARVAMSVVRMSAMGFRHIHEWQKWFDGMANEIIADLKARGCTLGEPPTFQLAVEAGKDFFLIERTAQIKIPLGTMDV